ncbi:DVUA0089 family protein [Sphingomonas sp.]|uniref:DVUA0089 family protein n=1 Tax=Sphingomonas sp. TaxID=28214 RepID=UPI00286B533D|nr:DVUA0089 family protein [Sphingomonas sp.]
MKTLKIIAALTVATMGLSSAPALATDFSFTGSLPTANTVQLFNFIVGAPSTVTLRTYSYAGGMNSAGTVIAAGGFDPILSLFDSTGLRIGFNDDGAGVPVDPVTGAAFDTLLSSPLGVGSYTVSVSAFSNFAIGPNLSNGFSGGGSFTDVTQHLRTNQWAFDVLNVGAATQVGGVPEPATWAMMLIGFGAAGVSLRYRRRKTVLAAA